MESTSPGLEIAQAIPRPRRSQPYQLLQTSNRTSPGSGSQRDHNISSFQSTESIQAENNDMASSRASTMMLLPPSVSMPPSIRDKAKNDAKDYQRVIEASLKGSKGPEFQYSLQELIGKGSYGRVYLAKHKKTGEQVAVKIINIEALDSNSHSKPLGLEDAQKEIDILARLRDFPTVNVNVFVEAFPAHEHLCIISQYCSGGSLTTLRRSTQGNRLEEKYIRPIARELAFALRSVHAAGIVHRDVKCSNVMVDENGKIQLIDFGVAGIVMTTMPEDKRKTVIGTPHWMPPELQWDKPEISHGTEVDVWAYGITLYECAMGQPPNANIINPRQLRQLIRKNPVRLTDERFTPELRDLIRFVLEPDTAKRPTMEQVCQHPYIVGTEAAYPVDILQNLVQQYLQWESQGGIRHSLWMAGGAEKVDTNQSQADHKQDLDDGWNFSATEAFRRRMSQIDPSFNYSYDPFSPAIPEEPTLSNSPPTDDDEFGNRWTSRFDAEENQKASSFDESRADLNNTFQSRANAERGGKQLMNLFDPNAPAYRYTFGQASDLPLRHGGEASLHRQELSVSSNNGRGPTINLEDVSNKKRATMAWTWNDALNTGPTTETSNRDSDFFADFAKEQGATSRQSEFFDDLAPPPRPGLDRAVTMPIGGQAGDNRASTLDLDALLGSTSDYAMPSAINSSSFTSHSSTNHSFVFPNTSQHTSYGGTTLGSFSGRYMEEPLDSFEADMSNTAPEANNFTMRPATYHEPDRRGHTTTTSQLPADLVSSPAGSSFDEIARDPPSGTTQFPGSFDMPPIGSDNSNGVAGWQPRLRQPGWMNGDSFASSSTHINGSMGFAGGAGPNIPYSTRCQTVRPPVLAYPEALDARANPALLGQALQFQIQQAMGLLDSLGEQINLACDEELAHLDRIYGTEDESDSDEEEEEDEDAGYDGGQEYADGTETEDGFVTENDAENGTTTGEESSRSA